MLSEFEIWICNVWTTRRYRQALASDRLGQDHEREEDLVRRCIVDLGQEINAHANKAFTVHS
jgi:hypothetical protein